MQGFKRSLKGKLLAILVMLCTVLPGISYAETVTERPTGLEMTADLLLVRPAMLVGTILGTGVFVAALPFSALGGNVKETGRVLVWTPFKGTFLRCLGCSNKHTDH